MSPRVGLEPEHPDLVSRAGLVAILVAVFSAWWIAIPAGIQLAQSRWDPAQPPSHIGFCGASPYALSGATAVLPDEVTVEAVTGQFIYRLPTGGLLFGHCPLVVAIRRPDGTLVRYVSTEFRNG